MKKNIQPTTSNLFYVFLFLICLIVLHGPQTAFAQCSSNTLTLQPDGANGMDALITNYPPNLNSNGGNDPDFDALAWTISNVDVNFRSLLKFDLSSIPSNAVIQQAVLTFYNNPTSSSADGSGSHSNLTSSNASWLQKITVPWGENSVTWNNQPSIDTTGQVAISQSTSAHQDYAVDVKNLVQNMVNNPATNYGFMLRLGTEIKYCALIFASSDNANASKRPKLVVTYYFPITTTITANGSTTICPGGSVTLSAAHPGTVFTYQWKRDGGNISNGNASTYNASSAGNYTCLINDSCGISLSNTITISNYFNNTLTLQPNGATGIDALITNYPSNVNTNSGGDPDFDTLAWTISNVDVNFRSLLKFDLSAIPVNAVVLQAILTLYNNPTSVSADGSGSHSHLTTSNASWLQKTIAPWAENTVTWNNQPPVDTTGQIAFAQSTSAHQDYTVDVKNFVQNMVATPATNYGFMLRMQTEIKYAALIFASSDNADATKRPKLVINYYTPLVALITANGSTNICGGGSVTLNATPIGAGITYQWKRNNIIIPNAASSSYSALVAGNYTCVIADPCTGIASNSISVTQSGSAPPTPGTISGIAKPCPGDTGVAYSVAAIAGATSYNWTMPNGASISAGQGTRNITVNFSASFVSGTIAVTASNACGTSGARNKSVSRNIPGTPSAIIGQTDSLCEGAIASYSINPVSTATTYLWSVPAGVIIDSGQGTVSVNLTFPVHFTNGVISVKASNNCGFGSQRNLTVRGTPATSGFINGPSTACANQAGITYSIAAVGGAVSYSWSVPQGATITSGQGTTSIVVKFGTATGTVKVRAVNGCGVGSYTNLTVIINCREGLLQTANEFDVVVYPNPSKTFFTLNVDAVGEGYYTLIVRDIIGRAVEQYNKIENSQPFEFGKELSKGIYTAEILSGDERKVVKIVKSE